MDYFSSGLFWTSGCLGSAGFGGSAGLNNFEPSKVNNPGFGTVLLVSTIGLF